MNRIGVQLYSLRKEVKEEGLDTVLRAVADAGFRYVEFAGYYGLSPDALTNKLNAYGITGMSAHAGIDDFADQLPFLTALQIKQVYIPHLPVAELTSPALGERLLPMLKIAEENGIGVGYHNHAHEFTEAQDLFYALLGRFPALTAQLDVFWAIVAGRDPIALIDAYNGRVSSVHIKEPDCSAGDPTARPNPVPGSGGAGMDRIVAAAGRAGVTDFVLEVEGFPCPYRAYLKESYQALCRMKKNNKSI